MTAPDGHPDRSGINRFGEDEIQPDSFVDDQGLHRSRLGPLDPPIDWSQDPRSESAGEPRFQNDDYSPHAGPGYHEKEYPGVSGKNEDDQTWINRDNWDNQRSFVGKGPRGYQRSDDRIYEEVCEFLRDDPTVDASEIGVKVHDGIVTLEGHARDRMEKRLAELIACEVPGVLDVRNEINLS